MNTLTRRELQVVALIAEGYSNKKIGDTLGISHHTAKFHVINILRHLGVDNRAAAAALFGRATSAMV